MLRVITAVLLGAFLSTSARAQPPATYPHDARQAAWSRMRELMSTKVTFHADEQPLVRALARLSQQVGHRLLIDRTSLDDLGIGTDEPVSVAMADVSFETLLEAMLHPLELTWTYQHESIVIMTEEEAESDLVTRVHLVGDLASGVANQFNIDDYDMLIDVIVSTVASETWAENGGGEAEIRAFPQRKLLVISQTVRHQLRIENLLEDLHGGARTRQESELSSESPRIRARRNRVYLHGQGESLQPRVYDTPSPRE